VNGGCSCPSKVRGSLPTIPISREEESIGPAVLVTMMMMTTMISTMRKMMKRKMVWFEGQRGRYSGVGIQRR